MRDDASGFGRDIRGVIHGDSCRADRAVAVDAPQHAARVPKPSYKQLPSGLAHSRLELPQWTRVHCGVHSRYDSVAMRLISFLGFCHVQIKSFGSKKGGLRSPPAARP